jgi:UDP-N-acetylmuramate dehydrogenase
VERGLAGIEKLAGIPGTVAGAVVMNAGAFGQDISRLVARVDYVGLADGCAKTVGNADMRFGYRTSALKGRAVVITEVAFCFVPGEQGVLEEAARASLASRRSKHPLDLPNCGSVFKNPRDSSGSAGGLIEAAGLKGFRVGDIEVSEKHANFFVNKGHATAEDFRRLVRYVQERVYLESAVYLEPEVVFVGAFAEQLYETATHAA